MSRVWHEPTLVHDRAINAHIEKQPPLCMLWVPYLKAAFCSLTLFLETWAHAQLGLPAWMSVYGMSMSRRTGTEGELVSSPASFDVNKVRGRAL